MCNPGTQIRALTMDLLVLDIAMVKFSLIGQNSVKGIDQSPKYSVQLLFGVIVIVNVGIDCWDFSLCWDTN